MKDRAVSESQRLSRLAMAMGVNDFGRGFIAGYRHGANGILDLIRVHGLSPALAEKALREMFAEDIERVIKDMLRVIAEVDNNAPSPEVPHA